MKRGIAVRIDKRDEILPLIRILEICNAHVNISREWRGVGLVECGWKELRDLKKLEWRRCINFFQNLTLILQCLCS